jgi:hypothetical protein
MEMEPEALFLDEGIPTAAIRAATQPFGGGMAAILTFEIIHGSR